MQNVRVKVLPNDQGGQKTQVFYVDKGVRKSALLPYGANEQRAKMAIIGLNQRCAKWDTK